MQHAVFIISQALHNHDSFNMLNLTSLPKQIICDLFPTAVLRSLHRTHQAERLFDITQSLGQEIAGQTYQASVSVMPIIKIHEDASDPNKKCRGTRSR